MCHSERRFFSRSEKNDVRNPLTDCRKLLSANVKEIPQSLIRCANFGSFGMTVLFFLLISSAAFAQEENPYVPPAQKFFERMETGRYHDAFLLLDSSVQKMVSEKQIGQGWKVARKSLGAFKGLLQTRVEEIKPFNAVYLRCKFDSGTVDLKVVFTAAAKIVSFAFVPMEKYRMPPYADPSNMTESPIEVRTDSFTLKGILTLPKKGDHFPVVILVHGSGPEDKDETIKDNKPFKDLAYGLAANGIATLRYDKRTYIYGIKSAADPTKLTVKEETVDDAVSALKLAQTFKEIDPKKIFLLGHSLGAMCAPRIAKAEPFVAGIIMMAGNARPFEDLLAEQMAYVLPLQMPKKKADSLIAIVNKQVSKIKSGVYSDSTSRAFFGVPPSYWKDLKSYDQVATARSLTAKMLILQGEKDYQVTMTDFNLWKLGLASKNNVTFISYPGVFHLFMPGEGKPTDYERPEHISGQVITDIVQWIKK